MENRLQKIPDSPTPENAWVTVYRVTLTPAPGSDAAKLYRYQEGLFYCTSNKLDHELLLAGQFPQWEIFLMQLNIIGEAQEILGHATIRSRFDKEGYVFVLANFQSA